MTCEIETLIMHPREVSYFFDIFYIKVINFTGHLNILDVVTLGSSFLGLNINANGLNLTLIEITS